MTRLQSTLARVAAISALVALVAVPPVLVAWLIGRPYPDWSTLTSEVDTGEVSADTVMRLAALLFIAIWIWIVATIAAETWRLTGHSPAEGSRATNVAGTARRITFVHRLVRIALLGTVTTAATISTWPTTAVASTHGSFADSIRPEPPATAPVDPIETRQAALATSTIVADGRMTALSIAVDLGDEALRDDIVAMNRTGTWSGGVIPQGTIVTIPVTEQPADATAPAQYVVQPNDGMWNVAEALLGDGSRHRELRRLVAGQEVAPGVVFTTETDPIHPGWVFQQPDVGDQSATHTVSLGDTLWDIADDRLGDPNRWPEIWELNAERTMPDGQTFADPDHILRGWRLDIPTVADDSDAQPEPEPPPVDVHEPPSAEPTAGGDVVAPEVGAPPVVDAPTQAPELTENSTPQEPPSESRPNVGTPPPVERSPTTLPAPSPSVAPQPRADVDAATEGADIWTDVQRSVWATLVVGSLLTAGLAVTVRRLRNRRLSRLVPGRRLTEPSDQVAGTEHALLARSGLGRLATITALLRSFTPHAALLGQPPAVRAVQIGSERIEVLLARPEPDTPRGWTTIDGGTSWTHRYDDPVDEHRQLLAPALVTIGARTDEKADEVLLDIETAGSVAITGDRSSTLGLGRSMVLELATYPLGVSMDVSLVGIELDATEHCDRVWTKTTLERAVGVARRRRETRSGGEAIAAARAELSEDNGANDPSVIVVDVEHVSDGQQPLLNELLELCTPSSGTAVVLIGDHRAATERIIVDADASALWSGVDLRTPNVTEAAATEIAELLEHIDESGTELVEADEFMSALLEPTGDDSATTNAVDSADDEYAVPSHDVLLRLMGEPRVDGIELSADQTELLALLTCLRHRTEIHIGLVHDAVAPERARKTIENRMSKLRKALGDGSDGYELLPEAAPGRSGRSHYLVSPLVLTDIDLLEHRLHASKWLSSGDALEVLRDGLDLMRGPLLRSRRGFDFWPHSEGVIVAATNVIQNYACRLVELAAEADDAALVLETTQTVSCVLDNPLAECPIRQAEQAYAEASGNEELLASVERARRKLLEHIDNDDTFAEAG